MNVTVDQAREQWAELIELVSDHDGRVRLLHEGKPVAALISVDDLELLKHMEAGGNLPLSPGGGEGPSGR